MKADQAVDTVRDGRELLSNRVSVAFGQTRESTGSTDAALIDALRIAVAAELRRLANSELDDVRIQFRQDNRLLKAGTVECVQRIVRDRANELDPEGGAR